MKSKSILCAVVGLLLVGVSTAESLYEEGAYRGLVNDAKAQHIGDSITILIVESSNAETKNVTDTSETTDNSVSGSNTSNTESLSLDTGSNYKSGGEVARKGELLARMTATIHEVLPTGELRIKGEQIIQINEEVQTITLTGNIRPMDISANNTVLSTRIANAKILYKGKGYTSDDKPGVITEFFRWLF